MFRIFWGQNNKTKKIKKYEKFECMRPQIWEVRTFKTERHS